jgi:REP element-mobilizing transposase RayT
MANRPPRLSGFSYVGVYQYFLTICCDGRQRCFEEDAEATWMTEQIAQFFEARQFAVIAYCVMPDHVHLLLEGLTDDADLKAVMHDWKLRTGFAWKQRTRNRLWQEGYYDHIVREEDPVIGIVRYILDNPFRARLVAEGTSYRFSGSSRFGEDELRDALVDWRPPWSARQSDRYRRV